MPDVTIRPARTEDATAFAACIDAAYAPYRARLPDLPDVSSGVAEAIATQPVWVAEADGVILGGLIIAPADGHAILENVAVHPDHSGRGIARSLIATAEAASRADGARELRLATHVDMPENVRLYARLGWIETDRTDAKVHMSKPL